MNAAEMRRLVERAKAALLEAKTQFDAGRRAI